MISDLIRKCSGTQRFIDREILAEDLEYIISTGNLYIHRGCGYGNVNPSVGMADRPVPAGEDEQDNVIIGVVNDRKLIGQLAKCCHNGRWLESVPAVLVICTKRMGDDDTAVEKYRLGKLKEELYDIDPNVLDILNAREHIALSVSSIISLAACERGMAFNIVSEFDVYKASRVLKVPNSHLATYMVALGFCDDAAKTEEGNTPDGTVFYNIYNRF